jgi:integrase
MDPAEERRKLRAQPTLDDLFKYYLEQHAKVHKRERSWQDDEKQYRRYLTDWRTRRLATIRQSDIKTLHTKLGTDHGHYAANRLLALLHKMFNEAAGMGFTAANPAHGVRKYREESRERFLQPDELRRFIVALDAEPDANMADVFWLLLLTGARRGNVCAMEWVHIDLSSAVWTIPPSAAKAGYAITIPLTSKAVEILQRRKAANLKGSEYVFPSYGKTGHITEAKAAWKLLLKRAGIVDLRLHDLRRTMGSWQAATGASLPIIGKSLGHRNVSTTAIYARLNIDPVRASVNKATDAMLAAGGVVPVAVAKVDQVG